MAQRRQHLAAFVAPAVWAFASMLFSSARAREWDALCAEDGKCLFLQIQLKLELKAFLLTASMK